MSATPSKSTKSTGLIGPAVALILIAAAAWYWLKPAKTPAPQVTAQPVKEMTAPAPVIDPNDVLTAAAPDADDKLASQAADAGEDSIQLPAEQTVAAATPLPSLDESDAVVLPALQSVKWQPGLASLFVKDELIRRFVVQIDNIAQGRIVPEQAWFKGLAKDFKAAPHEQGYRLDASNYQRYDAYLDLLESAPAAEVAALFQQFYPLMQAAYQELGYPDQQFRDRLNQAIDVLLAAPEISDEPLLLLPSVHYRFAKPELEQLGLAQKQLVRMGNKNQQRLKQLLLRYRPLLLK